MERFQKIKTVRRKLNVNVLCRCCGLENDELFNILQIMEDGVEFKEKILSMMGISVNRADEMPQSVCAICYDKINDFYEFRLMVLNTEKQTREALGLPAHVPPSAVAPASKPVPQPPPRQVDPKKAIVRLVDLKYSIEDKILIKKAFERLSKMSFVKEERDPSPAPIIAPPPAKKSRKDCKCKICNLDFSYITDLQDHQIKDHLPSIAKYGCGSCRETFEQQSDFKEHEAYHTKKRIPYECYICLCAFNKMKEFAKHMTNYNCAQKEVLPVTMDVIKCFQCKKKFITQNFFEWHGCFIKTRGNCLKCGQRMSNKKTFMKHYMFCEGQFVVPQNCIDPNEKNPLKMEKKSPENKVLSVRKKTVPSRKQRQTIFKSEKELNVPAITHAEGEEDDMELDDYNDDNITYDNYGSDDESNDFTPSMGSLEPIVNIQQDEEATPEPSSQIINIKAEKTFDDNSTVQQNSFNVDLIRRIKREQIAKNQAIKIQKNVNPFAVRVKRERENGDESLSAVKVINPFSKPTAQKTFKIPQALIMKIKKEKNQKSSIVVKSEREEDIDEADADPEEEAAMLSDMSFVKKEKVETGRSAIKQFINPIALAMLSKSSNSINNNGSTENNSLVISSVLSFSESQVVASAANGDGKVELQSTLTETTTTNELANDKMMTEIPSEFNLSREDQQNEMELPLAQQHTTDLPPSITENHQIDDVLMNNSNDELDELLEKYGGNGELRDEDIQDLLKFD